MEMWKIELLKIGAIAIVSFLGGLGSFWLYIHKRKIERAPEQEDLQEAEKLTTLLIQHRKHKISPLELNEFKKRLLSRSSDNEVECRNIDEIINGEEEFFDKVWYGRHKMLEAMVKSGQKRVDYKIWQGALEAAKKIEIKYGKKQLGSCDDFEWGMLNGKLSALRWVLGDEWDMLDT
jgi:hypothetical protein